MIDLILVAIFVLLILSYYLLISQDNTLKDIPEPPSRHWLWGHDFAIYSTNVGDTYRRWFDDFGSLLKFKGAFGHPYILVSSDIGITKHILVTRIYDYHHSKTVRPRIERLLGRSLGWVEGEHEHKRMRKLVSKGLSIGILKSFTTTIYDSTQRNISRLAETIQQENEPTVMNILDLTSKITLDITGQVSFGFDFALGESDEAKAILGAWRKMATVGVGRRGFTALILLRRLPFLNYLPVKANRAHSIVKTTIQNGVAQEMVRRECNFNSSRQKSDLLSILLTAYNKGEIPKQELMDHISMFIMAGHETTAQTVALTLWELARNPTTQERLRSEIKSFHGEPGFDDLATKLPYLDAVCRETLRVHPALPYMERVATEDDILPLATPIVKSDNSLIRRLRIKKGQIIVTPIISIQQQKIIWGKDACEWKPERWLEGSKSLPDVSQLPSGWSNLLAFSDGPRNCVGWKLGLFQYKIIMFCMLKELSFVDTGASVVFKVASSLQPCLKDNVENGPNLPLLVQLTNK